MRLKCPACQQHFNVPDSTRTGKGKCPKCGQKLDLDRMVRPGDLQPGSVLGGCRVEGLLGRGGMAVVYKATQLSLERTVALKALPQRFARNRQFVERFSREASALARLSHPNIVGILDKGAEGDTYYFVMEYVDGKSLRDRLLREGKLSPTETLELMQGICAALEYAHEHRVVHRDLKPGNILLDAAGAPKLADFGIARIVGTDTSQGIQLTSAHMVMGSADYMAPEQRESAAACDHRADIYALGVMLYQMLAGQLPVGTFKPVSRLVSGVPSAVDRVIRTALATSPADRYDSVAKLRAALMHAFAEAATRPGHRAGPGARRKPSPALGIAITAGVVVVLGAIAIAMATRRSGTPPTPIVEGVATKTPVPVATRHAVTPEPPRKVPEKAPPSGEEAPAVKQALAEVRQFMHDHDDDYQGQIERLTAIILGHGNPEVVAAARREMREAVSRLNQATANYFGKVRQRGDELVAQREFAAAIKAVGNLPANLSTAEARKQALDLAEEYRGKAWAVFNDDRKRAEELLAAGKLAEAVAIFRGVDYGLPELNNEAATELQRIQKAATAQAEKARLETAQQRAALTEKVEEQWADRQYAEALKLVDDAIAKAPNDAARVGFETLQRAARLLDAFWAAVLEGAKARAGSSMTIKGVKYEVKGLDGDELVVALPVGGETKRDLRKLSVEEFASLARHALSTKKADDCLALALFHTYDGKPDPALAAKAFDQALALGASQTLVAAVRDLTAAAQADIKAATAGPAGTEPEIAGFALDFNGASDYVDVRDDKKEKSLRLKTFTAEAWVWYRGGPEAEQYVLAKNAGWTTSLSFGIYMRDGHWAYATGDGMDIDFTVTRVPCPAGKWVHCALVCDDVDRALYVDGKLADRTRARRHLLYDEQPLYIGARSLDGNPASFWNGGIDDVRLTYGQRYRKDFTPERPLKADSRTHLLLHFDEGKGLRARDLGEFRNNADIRGARFLAPGDFKLAAAPSPKPPPKQPPAKQPQPPPPPKK